MQSDVNPILVIFPEIQKQCIGSLGQTGGVVGMADVEADHDVAAVVGSRQRIDDWGAVFLDERAPNVANKSIRDGAPCGTM